MAKTKQFTISIDNQPGAVAHIAKTLGEAKVNILSLLGTAQGAAGTVQLIAEDPRRAKKALDGARISYQETPAEIYDLANKPGALAQCLLDLVPGNSGGNLRFGQQARCAGAMLGQARSERCQPEFHPRHRRQGRQKGRPCLHCGSCHKSGNCHCLGASLFSCRSCARQARAFRSRRTRVVSSWRLDTKMCIRREGVMQRTGRTIRSRRMRSS